MSETREWQDIATWLASCAAATLEYDGELKSMSKARRERHEEICRIALASLQAGRLIVAHRPGMESTMDRLRDALIAKETTP